MNYVISRRINIDTEMKNHSDCRVQNRVLQASLQTEEAE